MYIPVIFDIYRSHHAHLSKKVNNEYLITLMQIAFLLYFNYLLKNNLTTHVTINYSIARLG